MDCVAFCGADVCGVHGNGGRGDSNDAGKFYSAYPTVKYSIV